MFNPSTTLVYHLDRNYIHKMKKAHLNLIAGRGIRPPKDASMKARDNYSKHYAMIRQVTGVLAEGHAYKAVQDCCLECQGTISSRAHWSCFLLTWRIRLILRGPEGERYADQNNDSGIQEFCSGVRNITEFQILGLPFFIGSWQIQALERILGAAQNLKTFKFVSDGYSCWHIRARSKVSPTQLIEFLSPRTQKTLQRFSLNFDGRLEPGQRNLPKPKPITPQQIKHFTNLTILEVDSSCFYSHVLHHNKDELIVEQETYLVNFLLQTVQTLTIFFDRWARYELLHFITYLGQRVVSGDLPKLTRVQIDAPIRHTMPGSNSWDDDWDNEQLARLSAETNMRREAFQEAFVASGVEMRFKTWYIWEEGW
ncbi:hypothetical protein ACJA88_011411 [Fusarium oxysporum]